MPFLQRCFPNRNVTLYSTYVDGGGPEMVPPVAGDSLKVTLPVRGVDPIYIAAETIRIPQGVRFEWPGRSVVLFARQIEIGWTDGDPTRQYKKSVEFNLKGADGEKQLDGHPGDVGSKGELHYNSQSDDRWNHYWYFSDYSACKTPAKGADGQPGLPKPELEHNPADAKDGGSLALIGTITLGVDVKLSINCMGGNGADGSDGGPGGPGGDGCETGDTDLRYRENDTHRLIDGAMGGSGGAGGRGGHAGKGGTFVLACLNPPTLPDLDDLKTDLKNFSVRTSTVEEKDDTLKAQWQRELEPGHPFVSVSCASGTPGKGGKGAKGGAGGKAGWMEEWWWAGEPGVHLFNKTTRYTGKAGAEGRDRSTETAESGMPHSDQANQWEGRILQCFPSDWKDGDYATDLGNLAGLASPVWLTGVLRRLQLEMQVIFGMQMLSTDKGPDTLEMLPSLIWMSALAKSMAALASSAEPILNPDAPTKFVKDIAAFSWLNLEDGRGTLSNAVALFLGANLGHYITPTDRLGQAYDVMDATNVSFAQLEDMIKDHASISQAKTTWQEAVEADEAEQDKIADSVKNANKTIGAYDSVLKTQQDELTAVTAQLTVQFKTITESQKAIKDELKRIEDALDDSSKAADLLQIVSALSTVLMFVNPVAEAGALAVRPIVGGVLNVAGSVAGSALKETSVDTLAGKEDEKFMRGQVQEIGSNLEDATDVIGEKLKSIYSTVKSDDSGQYFKETLVVDQEQMMTFLNRYFPPQTTKKAKALVRKYVEDATKFNELVLEFNRKHLCLANSQLELKDAKEYIALADDQSYDLDGQHAAMYANYSALEAFQRRRVLDSINRVVKGIQLLTLKPSSMCQQLRRLGSWDDLLVGADKNDKTKSFAGSSILVKLDQDIDSFCRGYPSNPPHRTDLTVSISPTSHPRCFRREKDPDGSAGKDITSIVYDFEPGQLALTSFSRRNCDVRLTNLFVVLCGAKGKGAKAGTVALRVKLGGTFEIQDEHGAWHMFKTAEDVNLPSSYSYPEGIAPGLFGTNYGLEDVKNLTTMAQEGNNRISFGRQSGVSDPTYPSQGVFRQICIDWYKDEVDVSGVTEVKIQFIQPWYRTRTDNPGLNETPIVALSFGVLEKHLNALWRLWTDVPLDWKLKSLDLANRIYGVQYKKDQIGNSSKAIRKEYQKQGREWRKLFDSSRAEVRRIEQEADRAKRIKALDAFWKGRSTTIDGLASISSGLLDKTGGAYGYRMFRGDGDDAEPDPGSTGRLTTADTTASARQLLARALWRLPQRTTFFDTATSARLETIQDSASRWNYLYQNRASLAITSSQIHTKGGLVEGSLVMIGQQGWARIEAVVDHVTNAIGTGATLVLRGMGKGLKYVSWTVVKHAEGKVSVLNSTDSPGMLTELSFNNAVDSIQYEDLESVYRSEPEVANTTAQLRSFDTFEDGQDKQAVLQGNDSKPDVRAINSTEGLKTFLQEPLQTSYDNSVRIDEPAGIKLPSGGQSSAELVGLDPATALPLASIYTEEQIERARSSAAKHFDYAFTESVRREIRDKVQKVVDANVSPEDNAVKTVSEVIEGLGQTAQRQLVQAVGQQVDFASIAEEVKSDLANSGLLSPSLTETDVSRLVEGRVDSICIRPFVRDGGLIETCTEISVGRRLTNTTKEEALDAELSRLNTSKPVHEKTLNNLQTTLENMHDNDPAYKNLENRIRDLKTTLKQLQERKNEVEARRKRKNDPRTDAEESAKEDKDLDQAEDNVRTEVGV